MPAKSSSHRKVVDDALNISEAILKTLNQVSNFTPVPFLGQVASCALRILDTVKQARNNKAAFEKLASDTCHLVFEVIEVFPKEGATPQNLQKNLKALLDRILDIERYTKTHAKRRTIVRFFICLFTSNGDADKIAEYTKVVKNAFELFNFQSIATIRLDAATIKDDTQTILEKLEQKEGAGTQPAPPLSTSCVISNVNCGNNTVEKITDSNNVFSVTDDAGTKNRHEAVTVTKPPIVPPVYPESPVIDPIGSAFTSEGGRADRLGANLIISNTNCGNTKSIEIMNSGNIFSSQINGGRRSPAPSPRGPKVSPRNSRVRVDKLRTVA